MRDNATHRSTIRLMIGTTIGAAVPAFHSEAPLQANICFVLCAFSVAAGILRFLYYRNGRNDFAEEMDYRRTLVREDSRVERWWLRSWSLSTVVASLNPSTGGGVNIKVPIRFSHNPREEGWGTRTKSWC
jgi:hypothetical protein